MTTLAAMQNTQPKVALVTGAAQRIGACIAQTLHGAGYNVILHYRHSGGAAATLAGQLNAQREGSCASLQQDLLSDDLSGFAQRCQAQWGRIDLLVNNASSFYPTTLDSATQQQWQDLMGSNLRAPYFLIQALQATLIENAGAVVNIVDVYAQRPLPEYTIYSMAKAGLQMLTKALAVELAPAVRVNGVAPGAILWPNDVNDEFAQLEKDTVAARLPLARKGEPADIADAVLFLAQAPYVTGQILPVDGGRTLMQ